MRRRRKRKEIFGNRRYLEDKKNREEKGGRKYLEKRNIFVEQKNNGEGVKCLEKENIWRTKICGLQGRRKRKKYLEKYFVSGGEEEQGWKRWKVFREGKYLVGGGGDERRRKRRKISQRRKNNMRSSQRKKKVAQLFALGRI